MNSSKPVFASISNPVSKPCGSTLHSEFPSRLSKVTLSQVNVISEFAGTTCVWMLAGGYAVSEEVYLIELWVQCTNRPMGP